jgi:anti-sigma regulatory factor (Ser/Thr protein kinase)
MAGDTTAERVWQPMRRGTLLRATVQTFEIPRDVNAPSCARRMVEGLASTLPPDRLGDVTLLVSELVTNSVKYGGDSHVTLRIAVDGGCAVRVDVTDRGGGFVARRRHAGTEPGGWGLHLVQVLSDHWGVAKGASHVWFEIDR